MLTRGQRILAIEVESSRSFGVLTGIDRFLAAFPAARALLVGEGGMPLEEFLSTPVEVLL